MLYTPPCNFLNRNTGRGRVSAAKIEIRDLSVVYFNEERRERHLALDGVSFDIRDREFLCVVGPSGCGKSTLISVIAGFLRPISGSVTIDSIPVTRPGADRGVVFQEYALLPWKNVIENVAMGLKFRGIPKEERLRTAREYLELTGLSDAAMKYPHELSGGMKQRAAVARTLANSPDVMLMDEPFAAVDAQTRFTRQEELERIWQRTQVTVIFVTHSVEEAIFLADRIIVLTPGPGKVQASVDVDIPRKDRSWKTMGEDLRFQSLRSRIFDLVRQDPSPA
jgi:NitT/TauT family transport system ATP-binding protein